MNERHHPAVPDTIAHFCEKRVVWDCVKVALQVRIYHPAVARFQMPVHFAQRIFAA
jgi:hypothetical protein